MPKTMRNAECGTGNLFVLFGGIPSLRSPDALGFRLRSLPEALGDDKGVILRTHEPDLPFL
jgi:hypothetical protein